MSSDPDHDNIISSLQGEDSPTAKALCQLLLDHKEMKDAICGNKKFHTKGLVERTAVLEKSYTYLAVAMVLSIGMGAAASHNLILGALKLLLP